MTLPQFDKQTALRLLRTVENGIRNDEEWARLAIEAVIESVSVYCEALEQQRPTLH